MERINQFAFFDLGKKLQNLIAASEDGGSNATLAMMSARSVMRNLVSGSPIPLGVSKAKAKALAAAIESLWNQHFMKDDNIVFDAVVESWRWSSVKTAIASFETVFSEEMREADTYRVPARGIYSTSKLIDAADETFPADLRPIIPEKTRADWCAAGRCLAFNLLSASGFHVARAVEGTIESYYQLACGIAPDDKKATLKGWHDYITALSEAMEASPQKGPLIPTEKTISELRQMKDDYRNPIAHPRIVLSEADARMLFANGESVIIAMAQEIKAAIRVAPAMNAFSVMQTGKEAS